MRDFLFSYKIKKCKTWREWEKLKIKKKNLISNIIQKNIFDIYCIIILKHS